MIILHNKIEIKNTYKRILDEKISALKIEPSSLINLDQWDKIKVKFDKKFRFGIEISSDQNLSSITNDLKFFSMIQISFESFKDGRGFTMAKELKKNFKFEGELRASGDILPDQFIFLIRTGFETVEIKKEDKDTWIELLDIDGGLYYQP